MRNKEISAPSKNYKSYKKDKKTFEENEDIRNKRSGEMKQTGTLIQKKKNTFETQDRKAGSRREEK